MEPAQATNAAEKRLSYPLAECAFNLYSQTHEFDKDDCSSIVRVDKMLN